MTTKPDLAFPTAYWPDILRLISLALRDIDVSQASLPPECFRDWLNDPPGFFLSLIGGKIVKERRAYVSRATWKKEKTALRSFLRAFWAIETPAARWAAMSASLQGQPQPRDARVVIALQRLCAVSDRFVGSFLRELEALHYRDQDDKDQAAGCGLLHPDDPLHLVAQTMPILGSATVERRMSLAALSASVGTIIQAENLGRCWAMIDHVSTKVLAAMLIRALLTVGVGFSEFCRAIVYVRIDGQTFPLICKEKGPNAAARFEAAERLLDAARGRGQVVLRVKRTNSAFGAGAAQGSTGDGFEIRNVDISALAPEDQSVVVALTALLMVPRQELPALRHRVAIAAARLQPQDGPPYRLRELQSAFRSAAEKAFSAPEAYAITGRRPDPMSKKNGTRVDPGFSLTPVVRALPEDVQRAQAMLAQRSSARGGIACSGSRRGSP